MRGPPEARGSAVLFIGFARVLILDSRALYQAAFFTPIADHHRDGILEVQFASVNFHQNATLCAQWTIPQSAAAKG
jgi:hypothetical protein